ncbi:hypothetical protein A2872_04040 [Candidatus Gottesmanbacteria bacterium RIFCSPHIGHO2_01_FULL_42_12]|uniref:Sortase n=1 Tax=Candidatus Gottesmanbacteria bacterium RIFCSPHIGHO2_01_FULL_42_12 TaxID=1798377 RepID=A0A1F5Z404_9BACT|nr:MAG: hypothetical protein A2872_04040 [Candidatus Gottesmanbacteria bacterium RIFCSPHIGHO2_01_FULL_42_12]
MAKGSGLLFILLLTISLIVPRPIYPADEINVSVGISDFELQSPQKSVIIDRKLEDGYYLDIPKAGIFEQIKDNVDPFNFYVYMPVISDKVAKASGTGKNLTYLFAHSSDYPYNGARSKAIFANINNLASGDEIYINSYGKIKKYVVVNKKIVPDIDLRPLTQKPNEEILVLQTCWPLNSLRTRLIVTAKPSVVIALK